MAFSTLYPQISWQNKILFVQSTLLITVMSNSSNNDADSGDGAAAICRLGRPSTCNQTGYIIVPKCHLEFVCLLAAMLMTSFAPLNF